MERRKPIRLKVQAELVIDPRDEAIFADWDLEQMRHCVYDICESSAKLTLPAGIRATVRFITPTPFEIKVAELDRPS